VVAHASEDEYGFAEEYPGIASDGSKIVDVSVGMVQLGIQYYFKVYGEWPDNWGEVVEKGLCQVPLVGYRMELINPDDGSFDFNGDVVYDSTEQADGSVIVSEVIDIDGYVVKNIPVTPPVDYSELLPVLLEFEGSRNLSAQFADENWLRQFAATGMIRERVLLYIDLEGGVPCSLNDLIVHGLSPYDYDSVNPLTGREYSFDGRALDIYYDPIDLDSFEVLPVDGNGKLPEVRFTY
jgi:hypothetical protein